MASTRRSIFAERSKTSEELLNEMESLNETDARLEKNKDWQKAITEELKILDDQQGVLDNKYSDLATE